MGRFIFVLFVFALAINPGLRARVAPHVQWILDPVYERQVRSQVSEIGRTLEAEYSAGRPLATAAALSDFLRAHYRRDDAALDPWSVPFFIARDTWTIRVASAGRDQLPFTADDIASPPFRESAD